MASFLRKIGQFKAKTVVLEVFVCFVNFFGVWFPSRILVLLCIFHCLLLSSRRNFKKQIHAPSSTTCSRGSRVTRTEKKIQNIKITLNLKFFYRVNHCELRIFKCFFKHKKAQFTVINDKKKFKPG